MLLGFVEEVLSWNDEEHELSAALKVLRIRRPSSNRHSVTVFLVSAKFFGTGKVNLDHPNSRDRP
jgi:hypothetical protein